MAIDPQIAALLAQINANAGNVGTIPQNTGGHPLPVGFNPTAGNKIANSKPSGGGGFGLSSVVSPFQHVLDYLGRPLQAVEVGALHAQQTASQHGNALTDFLQPNKLAAFASGAVKGFEGKERTTGQQLVENRIGKGAGRGTLGFLADVGLDPLNLVGGKAVELAGHGIGAAKNAIKGVEDTAAAAEPAVAKTAITATQPIGTSAVAAKTVRPALGTPAEIAENATLVAKQSTSALRPVANAIGAQATDSSFPAVKAAAPAFNSKIADLLSKIKKPEPVVAAPKVELPPAPKALTTADLTPEQKATALTAARARVPQEFDSSNIASKFSNPYETHNIWSSIATDPQRFQKVTQDPQFKNWFSGIVKEEHDKVINSANAEQAANYAKSVQVPPAAVPEAPPGPVQTAVDTTKVPKKISDKQQAIIDNAVATHTANKADLSLTPLGQGQLRNEVAKQYYATYGKRMQSEGNRVQANAAINKLYAQAEKQVATHVGPPPTPALSDIMHTLTGDQLADPREVANALHGGTAQTAAVNAASSLPQSAQPSFVKSILNGLKQGGDNTAVTQARYLGQPEVRFHTVDAAARDLGLGKPPPSIDLAPNAWANEARYKNNLAFLGKAGDMLNKSFSTAVYTGADGLQHGMNPVEHSLVRGAKASVDTQKQNAVNSIRKIFKGTNPQGMQEAFRAAQTGSAQPTAAAVANHFENLKLMMQKAGVTDQEFLQQAKRIPALKEALIGNEKMGMDAWQAAGTTKPAEVMAAYTDAAFNSTLHSQTAGQLGKFFGAVASDDPAKYAAAQKAGWVPIKDDPSSAGAVFPKDIAAKYEDMLSAVGKGNRQASPFLQMYDKVLRLDKTGLTKYLPSHHINNDIGQKFMAFMDGLNNPAWYGRSLRVMASHDAAATGVAGEDVGKVALKTGSGIPLDNHAIMQAFEGAGLKPSFAGTADLAGEEPKLTNPLVHAVDQFSQGREVHNRLAHFMFALSQSKGTLDEAVQKAAMRVNASHADYGDLTPFEKQVMRRVIPFYTWQRKIAPTLVRNAAANPAKAMVYPKIQQSINQHFGIQPQPGNPFPTQSIVPNFLHEGIQATYGSHNGNPILGAFRTPFDDVIGKEVNHPVGNLLDMLTPALKIPYELNAKRAIGNPNIPTISKNQNAGQYLEGQVPLYSVAQRLTGIDPLRTGQPPAPQDADGKKFAALINLFTAGGLKEVTPKYQALAAKGK